MKVSYQVEPKYVSGKPLTVKIKVEDLMSVFNCLPYLENNEGAPESKTPPRKMEFHLLE